MHVLITPRLTVMGMIQWVISSWTSRRLNSPLPLRSWSVTAGWWIPDLPPTTPLYHCLTLYVYLSLPLCVCLSACQIVFLCSGCVTK